MIRRQVGDRRTRPPVRLVHGLPGSLYIGTKEVVAQTLTSERSQDPSSFVHFLREITSYWPEALAAELLYERRG